MSNTLVERFLAGADRDKLDPILDACGATYVQTLDENEQVEFKGKAQGVLSYLRLFIIDYSVFQCALGEAFDISHASHSPNYPHPRKKTSLSASSKPSTWTVIVSKKGDYADCFADKMARLHQFPPMVVAVSQNRTRPFDNILKTFNRTIRHKLH
jgi:hypothetical protein